jgi:hypothetical protein
VAGGRHCTLDRVEIIGAAGEFLAPADDNQQRVVDRDPEPDQRDQVLDDEEDLGETRDSPNDQEAGRDRNRGDEQRHEGEQRPEHERKHGERTDRADERLYQHALTTAAAVARERVDAGELEAAAVRAHGRERRFDAPERARDRRLAVRLAGRVDEREVCPPVAGDEPLVRVGGVGGDARVGERFLHGAHRRGDRRPARRSGDPPAGPESQDRDIRWRRAAVAVQALDQLVCLEPGLAGQGGAL